MTWEKEESAFDSKRTAACNLARSVLPWVFQQVGSLFVVGITVHHTRTDGFKATQINQIGYAHHRRSLAQSHLRVRIATKLRLEPRCESPKRSCTTLHDFMTATSKDSRPSQCPSHDLAHELKVQEFLSLF